MQIFIPFSSPIKIAESMYGDVYRYNRQISECKIIIDALEHRNKWRHPVIDMYRDHIEWVKAYQMIFILYRKFMKTNHIGLIEEIAAIESEARLMTPSFIDENICIQHRKRLYTKNPEHYKDFGIYGTSNDNWYIVDGELKIFAQK